VSTIKVLCEQIDWRGIKADMDVGIKIGEGLVREHICACGECSKKLIAIYLDIIPDNFFEQFNEADTY